MEIENQVEGQEDLKQTEPLPVEVEAREQGWVPKEDYVGDENKWLPADEFVRRKPLFDKINIQSRELKEVKKTLTQLAQHHAVVRETEYKRALESLKAQKRDAFVDGDPDKIIQIDEQIDAVKEEQKQFKVEQAQQVRQEAQAIHPEFEAWTNRNKWYATDARMKAYADVVGKEMAGTGKTPLQVLEAVEKQVKAEFPHRFENKNREKPGAVEGTSKGSGKQSSEYTPSEFERRAAKKFVEAGAFKTEADYYKELKSMNGKS